MQGKGHQLIGPPFSPLILSNNLEGLQVQPGKTLAIIGGDVFFESGTIKAKGGRLELGSVNGNSLVSISPTTSGWELGYEGILSFQNVHLLGRSLADVSGTGNGSIQIQGHIVTLTDGSVILNQNQGLLPAGSLRLNASESLEVSSGSDPIARTASSLRSETLGFGKAGDIAISTKQIIIRNGGQISNLTFGAAPSGNIIIDASNSVQVIGVSPLNAGVFSTIAVATFNSGDAGKIRVATERFIAANGGNLSTSTFGTGKGGDTTVSATNSIEIIGASPITSQPSVLSSTSLNAGKAGTLTIDAPRLMVYDGGRIDASTLASGDSGSVIINARDSVEISGTTPGSGNPSSVISSANIESQTLQNLFRLPLKPSGKSGDVTINTDQLSVTNGAEVTVSNDGSGDAGKLQINANTINITNKGGITATTAVGQGGDIDINSKILQLNNGNISATAGQQGTNGDGGNITIDTAALFSLGSSAITANAFGGRGGNIWINADGFFFSDDSRVEVSSQLGLNGTVQINGFPFDPGGATTASNTVTEIPEIASACQGQSGVAESEFIITGVDRLPLSPNDVPPIKPTWQDNFVSVQVNNNSEEPKLITKKPIQNIEAQGWIKDSYGNIVLTAEANSGTPYAALSANLCSEENVSKNTFTIDTQQ